MTRGGREVDCANATCLENVTPAGTLVQSTLFQSRSIPHEPISFWNENGVRLLQRTL